MWVWVIFVCMCGLYEWRARYESEYEQRGLIIVPYDLHAYCFIVLLLCYYYYWYYYWRINHISSPCVLKIIMWDTNLIRV